LKVTIIVFSPSGNTFKLAEMISGSLTQKGAHVQLVDFTRNATIFKQNKRSEYLEMNIEEHEVLMIGGPVYSHHMQYQVLELIKSLPSPGGKWGRLVIPFITFGKISSGEALHEAAKLFRETGRKNVLGMKVEALHCYTKKWDKKINKGMPGAETLPYVEILAAEIIKLEGRNTEAIEDISPAFDYQSKLARFKANYLLREKFMHRYIFPKVSFKYDNCKGCGKCEKVCPVQCLSMKNDFPIQVNSQACIHCAECFHSCPSKAINLNIKRFKPMIMKGAQGKGFLASNELPKTAVFLNDTI